MLNINIPRILPHEQVFSIQVGDSMFRLSGASLSSDGPSYFTTFFKLQRKNDNKEYPTLYIDRSPDVFRDVVRHLQGYYVVPKDEYHFVYLYADAHYYQLPKLIKLLFSSEIFVRIGSIPFRVPRDLLKQPGDSPNFFTLGFSSFFASPEEVFPGTKGLLRPPSVAPPSVPLHSDVLFGQLIELLKGTPLKFDSPEHRDQLIKECRYYHFRGLEQKIIPANLSFNSLTGQSEITVRIQDVKPQGVGTRVTDTTSVENTTRLLTYKRPFVDKDFRDLVLQVSSDEAVLRPYDVSYSESRVSARWGVQIIQGSTTAAKLCLIFETISDIAPTFKKLGALRLQADLTDCFIEADGKSVEVIVNTDGMVEFSIQGNVGPEEEGSKKRKLSDMTAAIEMAEGKLIPVNLAIVNAQFKIQVIGGRCVVHFVKIDAIRTTKFRNTIRNFL
ncbi:hypothetical protein V1514DRAFT_279500 [Lipomyces japonicus]|uniref:uncharacterized protein n=1 Tax=Lipomyces japonicus TaxID=56871 RepID=UPI0034CE22BD